MEAEFRATGTTRLDPTRHLRTALRRVPSTKPIARALEHRTASHLLRRIRPDLVWCNTVLTLAWAEAAVDASIPTIVHVHEQDDWLRPHEEVLQQLAAQRTVHVVGCASDTIDALAQLGIAATSVLHSPVDVEDLQRRGARGPRAGNVVIACGTADSRKGFDTFARAACADRRAGSRAAWRWVGSFNAGGGTTSGAVTLLGELDDPAPALASASIFVCPSRSESFPLVVLEAMALGKPIVASDLPGIREQVDDTAVLVPPGDADALLDAVRSLRDDPDLAADLGHRAHLRCRERWDIEHFRHEIADLVGRVTHQ